ncbi:hypothetical protein A3F08_03155 [Candidatus Berkelbacteria bacterium RIFCSPHIGHO2_12_FULL_36_9]|uniref:GxxExxY protein n=1 Tax=Candidatus Berkelbacteria bacterium RIFCSPHIGHO2_12_FULL_36_9 TaxID=1797469 RepID=A0A1F5EFY4_9BACT|nr:MAG: hypothetical protein A3F08_03155 [Candidatus Berkelbacteria bacterium RIFCSPHIGHO2_12_FULL_36_9]
MNKREDLIYPELSYGIVGILFDVYNEVGFGHKEKYYQNAIRVALKNTKFRFKEQVYSPLEYKEERIGKYFLDFLIEEKIILEIKVGSLFRRQNIDQVYAYLKANNLKLGIIANFTRTGVSYKRIVNIK